VSLHNDGLRADRHARLHVTAPSNPFRVSGPRVVIIGGGVAGLSAAYFLRTRGAEVTVLESGRLGNAASAGNAGWLCPAQAGPIAEPGLTAYGLRSLIDRESALYFDPRQIPRMLGWLARFATHCNDRDYRSGSTALTRLGRRTFELTERLVADGVAAEVHRRGLVVAAQRREDVATFLERLQPMRELGVRVPDRVLEGAELRELEPVLGERANAGILVEEHWHIHAPSYMAALAARLGEMGVEMHEDSEVVGLSTTDGTVREVSTAQGAYPADSVVLATGAWSPRLARQIGMRLPVQAGKGYSFEVEMDQLPEHALLLLDPHVGCSPLGDRLRIAGTMEFSGINERLDRRRIDSIVSGATRVLPSLGTPTLQNLRSGMRPIAPDGLPIIDRAPRHHNLFVATAYSMLGMTIAAPAAESLAEMVLTGERPADLEPFRATRFRWRRR
jgi:D-amino-acid dehydrogenase